MASGQLAGSGCGCSKSRSQPQSGQYRIFWPISDLLAARLSTMLTRHPSAAVDLWRRVTMLPRKCRLQPGQGL